MNNKVYIIDYDLLSPIGISKQDLHKSLKSNVQGEAGIKSFAYDGLPCQVAAEVKSSIKHYYTHEEQYIQEICETDRKFELTIALANLVENRFKNLIASSDPKRRGVIMGVGSFVTKIEQFEKQILDFQIDTTSPFNEIVLGLSSKIKNMGILNPYDIHSIYFANKFELRAFQKSTLTACTSSTQAIAMAYDSIHNNEADIVFAGGTDSIINTIGIISFGKLGVIPEADSSIRKTCMPFDINRKGTLAGESAGVAILASENFIKTNNITPIAEVLSHGNTMDGYKITSPDPQGTSMQNAIKDAINKAGLQPKDIDYINAHGTGTKQNDIVEFNSILNVFGEYGKEVPISSTKDRHGHAIAAAGIQELCVLLNCLENDFMPGNMNLVNPIDATSNLLLKNTTKKMEYALSNNFAFGGVNTVLALKNLT